MKFQDWKDDINQLLTERFGINISDTSISIHQLHRRWQDNETSAEIVQWLGEKYDLTAIRST